MPLIPICLKKTNLTSYFKINFCKLPSYNGKKVSLTYSEITFFCKLPSCNVPRSCPLRRHLRNTHVFLPSCALNLRSSSSTAASPEVHRSKSISSYRGVHAILSVVLCTLHTSRGGLYCRQQISTFLYSSATTPNSQIILPISFYRSTLLYTHNHARLTREDISPSLFVPPRCWSRSYFAVTYRKPAAICIIHSYSSKQLTSPPV